MKVEAHDEMYKYFTNCPFTSYETLTPLVFL